LARISAIPRITPNLNANPCNKIRRDLDRYRARRNDTRILHSDAGIVVPVVPVRQIFWIGRFGERGPTEGLFSRGCGRNARFQYPRTRVALWGGVAPD
jgi:hypothetical protein